MSVGMSCSGCGQKRAVPRYNINVDNMSVKAIWEDRAGSSQTARIKIRGLAFD